MNGTARDGILFIRTSPVTVSPDSEFAPVRYSGATLRWLESWDNKTVVRELETVPAGRYRIHTVSRPRPRRWERGR